MMMTTALQAAAMKIYMLHWIVRITGCLKKMRRSFCLISLAKKMLQSLEISHMRADIRK